MVIKNTKNARHAALMKAFGKAVRHLRLKSGCSQEELADRAELDRSYLSQIERGIKNATLTSVWRLATALNVAASEVMKLAEQVIAAGDGHGAEHSSLQLLSTKSQAKTALDGNGLAAMAPNHHDPTQPIVLVVDDDQDVCLAMATMIRDAGLGAETASNGMEAMTVIATSRVCAIVSDIKMQNGNGFELLESVRKIDGKIPLFFVTGIGDLSNDEAKILGASGVFRKPVDMRAVVDALHSVMPTRVS